MFNLIDKSKIWSLIEKYNYSKKHEKFVESLCDILKGGDIPKNLIVISPFLDMSNIDSCDLKIIDDVFSTKLEEVYF